MAELERTTKSAHPVITDVTAFCSFAVPLDIEAQITSATKALNLARQTAAILQRRAPRLFEATSMAAYEQALMRSVAGISETVAERVAKHIERHGMAVHGERWIKYGLDHMQDEKCPFCLQDIDHADLIGVFRDFFSEAYSEHTHQVEKADRHLKALRGDGSTGIGPVVAQNAIDFAFWNDVAELPVSPEMTTEQRAQIEDGIALLSSHFDAKVAKLGAQSEATSRLLLYLGQALLQTIKLRTNLRNQRVL